MIDSSRLVFIHGSSGEKSKTYKAVLLRRQFPDMLTPDFDGDLPERMSQLARLLGTRPAGRSATPAWEG